MSADGYEGKKGKRERPPSTADSDFSLSLDGPLSDDEQEKQQAAAKAKHAAIAAAKEKRRAEADAAKEKEKEDALFADMDGLAASSESEIESEEEQVPMLVDSKTGAAMPAWYGLTRSVADEDDSEDEGVRLIRGGMDAGRPRGGAGGPSITVARTEAEREAIMVDASKMAIDDRLRLDPAYRARANRQALYRRRNMRAAFDNDQDELEAFATAFTREHQYDIELTDIEDITRSGDYRRGKGEDPLESELLSGAAAKDCCKTARNYSSFSCLSFPQGSVVFLSTSVPFLSVRKCLFPTR
jgi:hypothetical protein